MGFGVRGSGFGVRGSESRIVISDFCLLYSTACDILDCHPQYIVAASPKA